MVTKKAAAEYFEWVMGAEGAFEKADGDKWFKSESSDGKYVMSVSPKTVFCTCPGFKLAPVRECRHVQLIKIFAAAASSAYEQAAVLKTDSEPGCPDCESKNCEPCILRKTTRKGYVQRYSCEDYKRHFSENAKYGPRWYPPETIAGAPGPSAGALAAGRSRTTCAARESRRTKRPRRTTPSACGPAYSCLKRPSACPSGRRPTLRSGAWTTSA